MQHRKILIIIIIPLCILLSFSCSTTRFVEPLEKGEWAGGINAGGPLINFGGSTIPIPLSSVYAGYGYKENLTLYGGIHTTSLLYKNLQLDLGARKDIFRGSGISPSISAMGAVNTLLDFRDYNLRIFPELGADAYWKYGKWRTHAGLQVWFDLYKTTQVNYGYGGFFVPSLSLGQDFMIKTYTLSVEYKRLGFNIPTENSVVDFQTIGGLGAQGIYFSCTKSFGYEKQE